MYILHTYIYDIYTHKYIYVSIHIYARTPTNMDTYIYLHVHMYHSSCSETLCTLKGGEFGGSEILLITA